MCPYAHPRRILKILKKKQKNFVSAKNLTSNVTEMNSNPVCVHI